MRLLVVLSASGRSLCSVGEVRIINVGSGSIRLVIDNCLSSLVRRSWFRNCRTRLSGSTCWRSWNVRGTRVSRPIDAAIRTCMADYTLWVGMDVTL